MMKMHLKNLVAGMFGAVALMSASALFATEAQARELRIAMQTNPGTAQYDGLEKFAELLKQKSGGKLTAKIFGGGVLGGDLAVISAMQGGTIDMSQMNASLLNGLSKEFAVLDFPFLFESAKEAYAVMDGPIGKELMDLLPAKGLVGLSYPELGFRHTSNSKRPVKTLEDLAGLKIRVIQTPVYVDLMNALGANATPLPFPEVYNALEQRAVDGATNPLITTVVMKFDEVQKYMTLTRHQYNPQIVIIGKRAYDSLSPDEQKVLREAAQEAAVYEREVSQRKEKEALEVLKTKLEVTELAPEEFAKMRERVKPVIEKYTQQVGPEFVGRVYAEIDKVRAAK
ncbi:TRAP transporter substrate-binding protein [Thauera phenylacetica]